MVAAYREGHAAAEWERKKGAVKPPRTQREVRRVEMQAMFDLWVPGIGSVPASFKRYRRERERGAFVVGWVDAMNGRNADPKTGDVIERAARP
jgi:hypothetical protein